MTSVKCIRASKKSGVILHKHCLLFLRSSPDYINPVWLWHSVMADKFPALWCDMIKEQQRPTTPRRKVKTRLLHVDHQLEWLWPFSVWLEAAKYLNNYLTVTWCVYAFMVTSGWIFLTLMNPLLWVKYLSWGILQTLQSRFIMLIFTKFPENRQKKMLINCCCVVILLM